MTGFEFIIEKSFRRAAEAYGRNVSTEVVLYQGGLPGVCAYLRICWDDSTGYRCQTVQTILHDQELRWSMMRPDKDDLEEFSDFVAAREIEMFRSNKLPPTMVA